MDSSRPGLLGTPLGQFGLGAVALVIGAALLFALIGAVSGDDDGGEPAAAPTTTSTPDDVGTPTGTPTTTASPDAGTPAPTASPDDDGTTAGPTEPATETAPAVDPSTITIQVLDGSDDAADQDAVAACLQAAGFSDLITSNRARTTYTTTTVFYTAGSEAAARQVADALGIGAVEQQPGNLSESVPVHVVTGQDGTTLC